MPSRLNAYNSFSGRNAWFYLLRFAAFAHYGRMLIFAFRHQPGIIYWYAFHLFNYFPSDIADHAHDMPIRSLGALCTHLQLAAAAFIYIHFDIWFSRRFAAWLYDDIAPRFIIYYAELLNIHLRYFHSSSAKINNFASIAFWAYFHFSSIMLLIAAGALALISICLSIDK